MNLLDLGLQLMSYPFSIDGLCYETGQEAWRSVLVGFTCLFSDILQKIKISYDIPMSLRFAGASSPL